MFDKDQIEEIKTRTEKQDNWCANTVYELIQTIESQQSEIRALTNICSDLDYQNKQKVRLDIDEFSDYLIENVSEAFEHQDRQLLTNALQKYFK